MSPNIVFGEENTQIGSILTDLEQVRRFEGKPGEFWARFMKGCTRLVKAEIGLLLVRDDASQGEISQGWKNLCVWPPEKWAAGKNSPSFPKMETIEQAAGAAFTSQEGFSRNTFEGKDKNPDTLLGVRLDLGEDKRAAVAVFFLRKSSGLSADEAIIRLKLAADIPHDYQMRRVADKAKSDAVQFVEALDLLAVLNGQTRYMASVMALCNEIASRFGCSRVSLGWIKGGYIRMQAISHMEKFEKKMDAVQALEAAMEEAFDQDEEVVYPQEEGSQTVTRNHAAFALSGGVQCMASLPIRLDDEPKGVLTCEREGKPFTELDINGLRLICDQAARRLGDLKKHDRWFGARMADSAREELSKLFGVEHSFIKCLGIIICLALAFLLFGRWEYRVEAPFILKTDDLAYLPAPFDGYINKVYVRVGDRVTRGDPLLTLDTLELLHEESAAIAEKARYQGESEKARARNELAEMKISLALKAQAEAKLDLIRYHLANAEVRAPFSGIVVEGDLKELQGAPVRQGDILFKTARIEKMYAELDLDERDVHEISTGRSGEIAFVSMPNQKFPVTVEVINPVAATKEKGNVFPVRCVFAGKAGKWWRPGMSGIAKINVGKRNLLWIFTHRTVDFLRMFFWW